MFLLVFQAAIIYFASANTDFKCPDAQTPPRLIKVTKSGITLYACGIVGDGETSDSERLHLTVFDVSYINNNNKTKKSVFSNNSELSHYYLNETKTGIEVVELAWLNKQWAPFISRTIICDKKSCYPGKPTCSIKRTEESKQSLENIKKAEKIFKSGKPGDLDEVLVGQLGSEALLGSKAALKTLNDSRISKFLGGAVSEAHGDAMDKIQRAIEAGCKIK